MQDHLRKALRMKKEFNPFHPSFDFNELVSFITNLDEAQETLNGASIKTVLFLFNSFHKEFYESAAKLMKGYRLKDDQILGLFFVAFNRNYLIMNEKLKAESKLRKDIYLDDIRFRSVKSVDPTIGDVNITSALETDISSLNIICNLFRHVKSEKATDVFDTAEDPIRSLFRLYSISIWYFTIKDIFEDAIWNNGSITIDEELNINVSYKNQKPLLCQHIGHHRMQVNVLAHVLYLREGLQHETLLGRDVKDHIFDTKQDKKLKKTFLENGCVKFELAKKKTIRDFEAEIRIIGAFVAFYPFIDLFQKDEQNQGLCVYDCLVLFALIQELVENFNETHDIDGVLVDVNSINNYPFKIHKQDLVNYLVQRTRYSSKQVNYFLGSLSADLDSRIDLWRNPVLENERSFYIAHIALISPIIIGLIDDWLERLGYPLDKRGKLFETYLRASLARILKAEKFTHYIEPRSFIALNGRKEEIDLILVLKNTALIAELKCIKHSTTPREYHNSLNTLRKASIQANRKKDFIVNNLDEGDKLYSELSGKEIIPVVITNNTNFTGQSVNGVPIVDFFILEFYFQSGELTSGSYQTERGKLKNTILSRKKCYSNEQEMNSNLKDFLFSPLPVTELEATCKIEQKKFSPQELIFDLYCDTCVSNGGN